MSTTSNFVNQPYFEVMGPIIILTAFAFLVMILELCFRKANQKLLISISMLGVVAAFVVEAMHFNSRQSVLNTLANDSFSVAFSILILISAFLVLLFTLDYTNRRELAAEHSYLILFAVVGALTMATSIDLVTSYVGLELLSIASYVLVALRKRSIRSVEGGIKYLIMGSIGSAVVLYGMSFVYGITGHTNLLQLLSDSANLFQTYPAITVLSFLLILGGMGVKLSLVPFHMWTPDAYDGAPAPVSAFLATLSKSAAFALLLRFFLFIFSGVSENLYVWAAILAALTMVVGNLIALPQRNMKRLLAFSSVAQAGYVLVPFAMFHSAYVTWISLFDSVAFYLFGYTFVTVGAFAIVSVVSKDRKSIDSEALHGLYQRSPWLALALTVFLLSLAGMPLTAGFLGKFYIFADAIHLHNAWLGFILFATSVISFYYYFGWIRKIYQKEPVGEMTKLSAGGIMNVLVGVCVLGTLVLGLVPSTLMKVLENVNWFS